MFAGIDIASERHRLVRLDAAGKPIGKPLPIAGDRDGCDRLLGALGPAPVLVALEATGHHWTNLFATLAAAGYDVVLLDSLVARRFQDSSLERTKTDAIDAQGLARLAFEKRPAPTRLQDDATEALRGFVHQRDRIRQDFDDRVRRLHRLVDLGFPEFTRHICQDLDLWRPPGRPRTRHRRPDRPSRRRQAHHHRGRHRPADRRPHHRRGRRSRPVQERRRLRRLRGRGAQPQAVRKANRGPRRHRHRTIRPRPPAQRAVDARPRCRPPKRLAPTLLRAPQNRRKASRARPHRRPAKAPVRHLQRR